MRHSQNRGIMASSTFARDVMTPDPACCSPGTTLDQIAKLMVQNNCGEIPTAQILNDGVAREVL
jgi:CBS domain-containing protein